MIVHKDNIRKAAELLSNQNGTSRLYEEMSINSRIFFDRSKAHLFSLLYGYQYCQALESNDQKINMVLAKY